MPLYTTLLIRSSEFRLHPLCVLLEKVSLHLLSLQHFLCFAKNDILIQINYVGDVDVNKKYCSFHHKTSNPNNKTIRISKEKHE